MSDDKHIAEVCDRFHEAIELIGKRWTGAVIFLLLRGAHRFAEIRAGIPDITDRMLSDRLQELEREGIVERTVFPETPVRIEYTLTRKGHALADAFRAVGEWAHTWSSKPAPPEPRARTGAPARRTAPSKRTPRR